MLKQTMKQEMRPIKHSIDNTGKSSTDFSINFVLDIHAIIVDGFLTGFYTSLVFCVLGFLVTQ